jgi:hypothetical protein
MSENIVAEEPVNLVVEEPLTEQTLNPVVEETLNPTVEETLNPTVEEPPNPTVEEPPNPTVELMKQHSKIALLIGLNYGTLQNRIKNLNNAKQILINLHNYTEENIILLVEPSREDLTTTLNTVIGSSGLVNEIIIYYAGYGNGINPDLTKEEGVIDNLAKVMVPADLSKIDVSHLLVQSCCKTLCVMDMCPYQDDEMLLKWGADITGNVKVVTFCESDSTGTRRFSFAYAL